MQIKQQAVLSLLNQNFVPPYHLGTLSKATASDFVWGGVNGNEALRIDFFVGDESFELPNTVLNELVALGFDVQIKRDPCDPQKTRWICFTEKK